jgi:hypothetical protein
MVCGSSGRREREKLLFTTLGTMTSGTAEVMKDCLRSTFPRLLKSVLWGNLAVDKRNDVALKAILKKLWDQAEHQAGIYHQQLVDDNGHSATPNQLLRALDVMLGYTKGCGHELSDAIEGSIPAELANRIDNVKGRAVGMDETTRDPYPYRKYMWTETYVQRALKPGEFLRAAGRNDAVQDPAEDDEQPRRQAKSKGIVRLNSNAIKSMLTFAERLRQRLASIPEASRDLPLAHPLVEVGYSKRCIPRLKQHAAHRKSNYLMNLMDAVFILFSADDNEPLFDQVYHIDQDIIYLIYSPEQSEISEIGWTKLAEGYIHNGGGFNHYPAGMSNHSSDTISVREWAWAAQFAVTDSAWPLINKLDKQERDRNLAEMLAKVKEAEDQAREKLKAKITADHERALQLQRKALQADNPDGVSKYRALLKRCDDAMEQIPPLQPLISQARAEMKDLDNVRDIGTFEEVFTKALSLKTDIDKIKAEGEYLDDEENCDANEGDHVDEEEEDADEDEYAGDEEYGGEDEYADEEYADEEDGQQYDEDEEMEDVEMEEGEEMGEDEEMREAEE